MRSYGLKFILYALVISAVIAVFGVSAYAADRNAALLRSGLEGYDSALVDSLSKELSSSGYTVQEVGLDNLCDKKFLSDGFDLLVVPDSGSLPAESMDVIREYLKLGKDIIALNAPAWRDSMFHQDGKITPLYKQNIDKRSDLALEIITPPYKFFDCRDVGKLCVRKDQVIVPALDIPNASLVRSVQPRPAGGGFDKGRTWRWIPLIEARTAKGEWRGVPAAMMIHTDGPYKGGVWASFGIGDKEWYRSPSVIKCIGSIAKRMNDRAFILDGGTDHYTYFEGQSIKAGARVANLSKESLSGLEARVAVSDPSGKKVYKFNWEIFTGPGEIRTVEKSFKPVKWSKDGFSVTTELVSNGEVIDRTVHTANVWVPKKVKHFITIKDGEFMLDGKTWRAHGINYMPSSCIAAESWDYYEYWLSKQSYDPQVIQRDLMHIKDIGFNSISIGCYDNSSDTQNLADVLRRADMLGLKANVALRPGMPLNFEWKKIKGIITDNRLIENDTVFAYDIAWEPRFEGHDYRTRWDSDWEKWVIERYGSIENAERDWGFPIPRNKNGKVTNPFAEQINKDGEWRRMVAAYRRFLDFLLYKQYDGVKRLIRAIDRNHYVSFRMAESANPTYWANGEIPYDFPYLSAAVDILEPEGYGRRGDWQNVKPAMFETAYARWAAPDKPMIWAEYGVSSWSNSQMENTAGSLERVAEDYRNFYRMIIESEANGVFFWWYPGGFRCGENSDHGMLDPDGSERPVTKVIRELGPKFMAIKGHKRANYWIEFDRDKNPRGVPAVYDTAKSEYWNAIDNGKTPGLKTAATGSDSSSCPLTAVGNVASNGSNPLKYLDGAIDSVKVMNADGKWVSVEKGGSVEVDPNKPVIAMVELMNLGEAKWIAAKGKGRVLVVAESEKSPLSTPIPYSVGHLQPVKVNNVKLARSGLDAPTEVTLTLFADSRARFGEKFKLTLKPKF